MPLEDFIRESIVDPNAYVAPGYNPPSTMPSFKTRSRRQTSTPSCSISPRTRSEHD